MNLKQLRAINSQRKAYIQNPSLERPLVQNVVFERKHLDILKSFEHIKFDNCDFRNLNCAMLNFRESNLYHCDFSGMKLVLCKFDCILHSCDFTSTNFRDCNFRCNIVRYCCFNEATFCNSNVDGLKYDYTVTGLQPAPEGSLIGWKKIGTGIVKLEIPREAKRSCATSRKFRCEYAKVLLIKDRYTDKLSPIIVNMAYGRYIEYKVGSLVMPDTWDYNRWNECSNGIHFFLTEEEALAWD
jgi:hypothetical protein